MGIFRKRKDPIDRRRRELEREIAQLEQQIEALSRQVDSPRMSTHKVPETLDHARSQVPKGPKTPQATESPVFEPAGMSVATAPSFNPICDEFNEFGVRKFDLPAAWKRLARAFSGPPPSNPKLVSYLAQGTVQGLRPLRRERRLARNRVLIMFVLLLILLWLLSLILGR